MDAPNTRRIVLVGKTGAGKSSLANTIFGEARIRIISVNDSKMNCTQAETKSVDGKSITLIDTPGFFDLGRSEEELKPEIVRCMTESAPGPHAFLIVLKVEKFTEHEQAVITKMCDYFPEDALKYAAVVFTHGDQLSEGKEIDEYVKQSDRLSDLVKKCGGRCHIVDNKYWKNNQQDEYRSNQFQVAELLNTIEKIVKENNGGYYTDEKLQEVEREIQEEEEHIKKSPGNMSQEEIRKLANNSVYKKLVNNAPRTWFKTLVGVAAITGLLAAVSAVLIYSKYEDVLTEPQPEKIIPPLVEELVKEPILPPMVEELVKEPVADLSSTITKVVDVIITPVEIIKKKWETVMERLEALFERTYDPFNPFE